jgi:hypothetical protein
MSEYKLLIDLNSIKRNSNAGGTSTSVYAGHTIKFTADILPNDFIDGENCYLTNWGDDGTVSGYILDNKFFEKNIKDRRSGIYFTKYIEHHVINHSPIPEYSYEYENISVVCCGCGKIIMTNDLESDVDGSNENYSNRICPKCGEFYCCDLIYEKIEDAIKRKKIIEK